MRPTLRCELDNYALEEFVEVARSFGQQRYGYVVTPNVDHFIRLHEDGFFRGLYSQAEYVLMDSRFLGHILRIVGRPRLPVCTGSDLTASLLAGMAGSSDRIVIIGGSARQVSELTHRYGLKNIAHYNPPMGFIRDPEAVRACLEFIEAHSPFRYCLLAVGSPQQEVIAQQLRARGVARGLALCIGASIDFLTGVEKRAPQWMQRSGLEWLHRLSQNPQRLAKRYLLRGPRIFWLMHRTRFVLRARNSPAQRVAEARAA